MSQESTNILNIIPQEIRGREQFVYRVLMLTTICGLALFLDRMLNSRKEYNFQLVNTILGLLFCVLLYIALSGKIIQGITLDLKNKTLSVTYITLTSPVRIIKLSIDDLQYSYKWQPSKYPPKKNRQKLFQNNTKLLEIDTNQDGFNKEQFDLPISKFEKLQVHKLD